MGGGNPPQPIPLPPPTTTTPTPATTGRGSGPRPDRTRYSLPCSLPLRFTHSNTMPSRRDWVIHLSVINHTTADTYIPLYKHILPPDHLLFRVAVDTDTSSRPPMSVERFLHTEDIVELGRTIPRDFLCLTIRLTLQIGDYR